LNGVILIKYDKESKTWGEIKVLNQELEVNSKEIESMIAELVEREEYACTGDVCGGDACGIN